MDLPHLNSSELWVWLWQCLQVVKAWGIRGSDRYFRGPLHQNEVLLLAEKAVLLANTQLSCSLHLYFEIYSLYCGNHKYERHCDDYECVFSIMMLMEIMIDREPLGSCCCLPLPLPFLHVLHHAPRDPFAYGRLWRAAERTRFFNISKQNHE